MEHKIKVGITQGDINGVGYEVILKTLSDPHIVGFVHLSSMVRLRLPPITGRLSIFRLLILILLAMHRQPMKIK